ncbi:undecaprenyl-diphosphatase UppP [Salisediminibacterium halotolerans]|uniref:undecaprenyl-diphosphatase UppP n=1 Tax=Salisediminibacterium halotolerans TaxID=517425 RepID=UPI000EB08D80|nr:undecaprenyl-diphosphatase UppP [Salisediminibacterium halotolerans]RLJ74390.1 undecaprenyl-diphosphatase [Actinophytocola xinjiangensis]RPE87517.1 undecaprenyl-diphosphatase [Salisediminibacterium halotolerans]TWG35227.1 undecaprenyl-diphosphatase [Salisediminibacterium halotolerans]GEL08953.1 undecaprenyl-diphosphatase 2 [Salisediminibacterium halotolerans]
MSLFEAIIFGIVQGLTEFLPISSSAHIVITQLVFGYTFPGLSFEIFLHVASVLAVILYFWKDLWRVIEGFFRFVVKRSPKDRTQFYFGLYILIATFITGILGILLEGAVGNWMKTPPVIASMLTITGLALIFIERFHKYGDRTEKNMSFKDSIVVGLGQTLAVMPGISRSGSTLIVSLLIGLQRETAVRYSFLLAIPVILGSTVLAIGDFSAEMVAYIGGLNLLVSFIITFVFSLIGIVWLIDFLKKSRLIYFAVYCFVLALFVATMIDPATVMDVE